MQTYFQFLRYKLTECGFLCRKMSDGLFLECCRITSKEYPDIQFDQMIIDNCSMQMVNKPSQFDLMVMPNLYGDVLSNIACGVIGGPGLVSGTNLGYRYAVFETVGVRVRTQVAPYPD